MLTIVEPGAQRVILRTAPATQAIVSWNTRAPSGTIEIAVYRSDGQVSSWLPYVRFSPRERRSLDGQDEVARIATDIIRSPVEIVAVEVRADVPLDAVAVSTPRYAPIAPPPPAPPPLAVPLRSQYVADQPSERGWCSPAALAMLLAFWGIELGVAEIAARVRDESYGGTGNWAFNTALAGALGLRGTVAHLRDLAHAAHFIDAGIPVALSFAWKVAELPGAPVEHSDGHLAVLCGFTERRDPIVNDPAQPGVATTYNQTAFERAWRTHGAIAYLVAPPARSDELVQIANR
ncbi:MAG TPA: C39 family peptidase [Candidatus Acidoferrales bacterium]|nr:C39 family peptidase [Candidatus Acidoferrales bacterium]